MKNESTTPKPLSDHRPSRRELRASFTLPFVITIIIWGIGILLYMIIPGQFNSAVAVALSLAMLIFLLYWTRKATRRLRVTAVILAIPALVGISLGMIRGRVQEAAIGIGITFLMLMLYRAFQTPISYRFAYRYFQAGDTQQALNLINKAIAARPDFWPSYQLRALIYLTEMDFNRAERSAKDATKRHPDAHPVYNTLGQIYLAQKRFDAAEHAYQTALALAPDNAAYGYHLGLCQYRQQAFGDAAQTLADTTKGSLPLEYELLTHYYLWRSLSELGQKEQARQVRQKMEPFADGVALLDAQLKNQPDYPHIALIRDDLADLTQQFDA